MKDLDWFLARALARGRSAVRRAGWQKWLLFRGYAWLISVTDPATNLETRRIATNTDLADSEYLAKDWTDEAWVGGTYPPCTNQAPSGSVPPAASGAWTRDPAKCAGAGEGGGVIPIEPGAVGGSGEAPVPVITAALHALAHGTRTPIDPTAITALAFDLEIQNYRVSPPAPLPASSDTFYNVSIWFSGAFDGSAVVDFSGVPVTARDPIAGCTFYAHPDGEPISQSLPNFGVWGSTAVSNEHELADPGFPAGATDAAARIVVCDAAFNVLTHLDLTVNLRRPVSFAITSGDGLTPDGADLLVWNGPDGINGTGDDVTVSSTACWTTGAAPATHDLSATVTISGGPGGTGSLSATVAGTTHTLSATSGGSYTFTWTGVTFGDWTVAVDYTDAASTHHTGSQTFHVPPTCVAGGGAGGTIYTSTPP